jgi:hypothetical protein
MASIIFVSIFRVTFIKYYTEIFHVVYKSNVPCFQCDISLNRSMSMGEVDSLSLILVFMESVYIFSPLIRCSICHLVAMSEKRYHTSKSDHTILP